MFPCSCLYVQEVHRLLFSLTVPDETSSERAPAVGVKRPLRAWPAQGVARSEDSGRWGA